MVINSQNYLFYYKSLKIIQFNISKYNFLKKKVKIKNLISERKNN